MRRTRPDSEASSAELHPILDHLRIAGRLTGIGSDRKNVITLMDFSDAQRGI